MPIPLITADSPVAVRDRKILVDTSAYFAFMNRRDADHAVAVDTMRRLVRANWTLTTTNVVLIELHGLLLRRLGRRIALKGLLELRESQTVEQVRVEDETRAEAILVQYDDKAFSLADAISFAVMERLGIRVAFSLDRHFAQFGWEIVPIIGSAEGRRP